MAMMWLESNKRKQAVTASDSSSALISLKHLRYESRPDIVFEIIHLATYIEIDIKYSKAEVKSIIKAKINEKWQFLWDNEQTGRYLYSIQGKWERAGIHTEKGKNKMWCLE